MTVLASYVPGPEGRATLAAARAHLTSADEPLVIVVTGDEQHVVDQEVDALHDVLEPAGLAYTVLTVPPRTEVGEHVITLAEELDARLIVFAVQRRHREGAGLDLGHQARRVLLEVACPVLVVKPQEAATAA